MSKVDKFASQPISDALIDELAELLYEAAIRSCTPRKDIRRIVGDFLEGYTDADKVLCSVCKETKTDYIWHQWQRMKNVLDVVSVCMHVQPDLLTLICRQNNQSLLKLLGTGLDPFSKTKKLVQSTKTRRKSEQDEIGCLGVIRVYELLNIRLNPKFFA